MSFVQDMNRCTGPKDWAQAHGIKTVGCRHACKLHPGGAVHVQCDERRACALEADNPVVVCTWDDWKPARDVA